MQYKLIATSYKSDLESAINKKLAEGWQLHGETFKQGNKLCQAVTRQQPHVVRTTGNVEGRRTKSITADYEPRYTILHKGAG